jgi:hypothetical protein
MSLRLFLSFAVFMVLLGAASIPAHADAKPWIWSWWPSHWDNMTFEPYLEGAKHPHNTQWDDKNWEPADWAAQKPKGSLQVIQGFYTAGILQGQDVEDDVPVLIVGPNFYHLSGYDKRRVVAMVDDYYKITSSKLNGMFTVTDWRSKKPIGIYTATGLQLQ